MEWVRKDEIVFQPDASVREGAYLNPHWISLRQYAENYKGAADAIVSAALERRDIYPDQAVYPAVFLYRHFIELILKDMIWRLMRLQNEGRFDWSRTNHRLDALWMEVKRLVKQHYASSVPEELNYLDGPIRQFMEHDPDSMAFRYPFAKNGNRHLENLSRVNLEKLREAMERIGNVLSCVASDIEQCEELP